MIHTNYQGPAPKELDSDAIASGFRYESFPQFEPLIDFEKWRRTLVDCSFFSKQARTEEELRCTYAEERDLAPPEIDQIGQEEDHFVLH